MDSELKLYISTLRGDGSEAIEKNLSPDFMEISEKELAFIAPIEIKGTVNLLDDDLMLTLTITTEVAIPCAICNQMVSFPITIPKSIFSQQTKGEVFDYKSLVRDTILLAIPQKAECHEGKCPKREEYNNYFSKGNFQKLGNFLNL